jgi:hypothetical protein
MGFKKALLTARYSVGGKLDLRTLTMKKLAKATLFLAFAATGALTQSPATMPCLPKEAVEQVWRLATQGELLTPEGWDKMARAYFVHPAPPVGSRVTLIPPSGADILVVSNDWGVVDCALEGDTAKVAVEYRDAGRIDRMLRFTRGKEPGPIGKSIMLYTLVFTPGHWETYKPDGKGLEVADIKTTPPAWQIKTPQGPSWTTINTAIRYVLEIRDKTADPAIKKNADETLANLLRLH